MKQLFNDRAQQNKESTYKYVLLLWKLGQQEKLCKPLQDGEENGSRLCARRQEPSRLTSQQQLEGLGRQLCDHRLQDKQICDAFTIFEVQQALLLQ